LRASILAQRGRLSSLQGGPGGSSGIPIPEQKGGQGAEGQDQPVSRVGMLPYEPADRGPGMGMEMKMRGHGNLPPRDRLRSQGWVWRRDGARESAELNEARRRASTARRAGHRAGQAPSQAPRVGQDPGGVRNGRSWRPPDQGASVRFQHGALIHSCREFLGNSSLAIPRSPTWPGSSADPRRSRAAPRCGRPAAAGGLNRRWGRATGGPRGVPAGPRRCRPARCPLR